MVDELTPGDYQEDRELERLASELFEALSPSRILLVVEDESNEAASALAPYLQRPGASVVPVGPPGLQEQPLVAFDAMVVCLPTAQNPKRLLEIASGLLDSCPCDWLVVFEGELGRLGQAALDGLSDFAGKAVSAGFVRSYGFAPLSGLAFFHHVLDLSTLGVSEVASRYELLLGAQVSEAVRASFWQTKRAQSRNAFLDERVKSLESSYQRLLDQFNNLQEEAWVGAWAREELEAFQRTKLIRYTRFLRDGYRSFFLDRKAKTVAKGVTHAKNTASFERGPAARILRSGLFRFFPGVGLSRDREMASGARGQAAGKPEYLSWIENYDRLDDISRDVIRSLIELMSDPPLISILLTVADPPPEHLEAAIDSVLGQLYPHFELCIVDDASTDSEVKALISRASEGDPRVKAVFRSSRGHISVATNEALALATGEWVLTLDHDDVLSEVALYLLAREASERPEALIVYSDEDKLDPEGNRVTPYFKSDWNPSLLLGQNYMCHFCALKTSLVRELGGWREGYEGSQDHDLVIRATEKARSDQIVHIPWVCYHWRMSERSTSSDIVAKPYAIEAARKAVEDHLRRAGAKGRVVPAWEDSQFQRVVWELPEDPPPITVIIPTKDGNTLPRCLETLLAKTDYPAMSVLLVDNGSSQPSTLELLRRMEHEGAISVVRDDLQPFNFSALNNRAVAKVDTPYVLLLNDDTEVVHADWLSELIGWALQPDVGIVGARLLYPNGTVQHAGVVLGLGGVGGHVYLQADQEDPGYFGRARLVQDVSAVTGACMLIDRSLYEELGGMDEEELPVSFNDVDLCMRARAAGRRVIYTPFATLIHHESVSRGHDDLDYRRRQRLARESRIMRSRYKDLIWKDPFWNPNLSLKGALAWVQRKPDDPEAGWLAFPPRPSVALIRRPKFAGGP
jgi:GT2 family glycosyltransferase